MSSRWSGPRRAEEDGGRQHADGPAGHRRRRVADGAVPRRPGLVLHQRHRHPARRRDGRPADVAVHAGHRVLDADAHVVEPASVFGELARDSMDLPPTTPFVPCGDADKIADQLSNGFDAPSYLRAMDKQGIDAVVLYPSIGLFVPFLPELSPDDSAAACRSYNDWMASYCTAAPARMTGVGLVPLADVDLAVAEAKRVH